ncbi:AraC family transcriptional regulator [Hymenobacter sp. YC55]|uniref:helix-turn-helix domain-containing protein n=1 Tax=Hymenobacter sp. YC55 TaxID=3034019 RepID=UPI0023F7421B|nr:AraC family transcriptional regulator [Hymenobacter sp. YC55]MDF7813796.1 AraC family transcriptional regulator [Hymenobacter sp. YC55]
MAFLDLTYRAIKPEPLLTSFVESFWMLVNPTGLAQPIVLVPDGRIDVFFSVSAAEPYHVSLLGLQDRPEAQVIAPHSTVFAISWNLLAVEYILPTQVGSLLQNGCELPGNFLGMGIDDLQDFEGFCAKAAARITQALPARVDPRKRQLFELLYASHGSLSVQALAEAAGWSSRQINRYFTRMFGLPLKAYSSILRFRATWPQLKAGQLYAEGNFADQAHFIREMKKYTGAVPKEVARNHDDRFIQLSTLPGK